VLRPVANEIADGITDRVRVIRTTNSVFLDDKGDRGRYLLRAVANETKGVRKAAQNHARLLAMHEDLIAKNTLGQPFPAPDAAEDAVRDEQDDSDLLECVSRGMAELAEKCREVMHLYYVKGKKPREIAEILGIKANSVHSHRKRARVKLREVVRLFLIDHPRRTDR
jgi:RNA polymerase sigma factor (sigma-70 family)